MLSRALRIAPLLLVLNSGCAKPTSCQDTKAYPPGPYGLTVGATFPKLDSVEPWCSASQQNLVFRIQAGWCGTCRWHAQHTQPLVDATQGKVRVLDVLVADDDNAPPGEVALREWRTRSDGVAEVLLDDNQALMAMLPAQTALPLVVRVDARSMRVTAVLSDPAIREGPLHDGLFTDEQWDLLTQMVLPAEPPPDPTNAEADNPAAAALGQRLFSDGSLSPSNVSCASCHNAPLAFTDGKDTPPEGAGPGTRNVPSLILASHARWQLWDGRADTLWMQALLPIEADNEFNSSRLFVAHAIFDRYKGAYEGVFGPLPALNDSSRFPAQGTPSSPAYGSMAPDDQQAATRVFVNVGKAIAAYERSLRVTPTALDRYAQGEMDALTPSQKEGLRAFFTSGCAQCHYGPRLTDDAFHNLRFPTGRFDFTADPGRSDGLELLAASEFRATGSFSDAPTSGRALPSASARMQGAFKTPGLRGVPQSAPYTHGGGYSSLTAVVEAHRTGGFEPPSGLSAGVLETWLPAYDPANVTPIVEFLSTLELHLQP